MICLAFPGESLLNGKAPLGLIGRQKSNRSASQTPVKSPVETPAAPQLNPNPEFVEESGEKKGLEVSERKVVLSEERRKRITNPSKPCFALSSDFQRRPE